MTNTPMQIINRPFSIEPITGIMLPDGIFDAAIFQQKITCYYTNISTNSLSNVSIYFEGIGDSNIIVEPQSHHFPIIPPGASVQVSWIGNFKNATPGKKNVSVIAKSQGHNLKREIKQIFVTRTTYNTATNNYICEVPEGTMVFEIQSAIVSKEKCKEKEQLPSVWLPTKMSMSVSPIPNYSGKFGELPFQDPWWKVVLAVASVVAAIGAFIAAALGGGKASVGATGKFDESGKIDCCKPSDGLSIEERKTVAGVLSSIATALGTIAAFSDHKDPWYRGQENTDPLPSEITIRETVDVEIRYIEPPTAGKAFPVEVEWIYNRYTNVKVHSYSVSEIQTNIHTLGSYEVIAPNKLKIMKNPFVFTSSFKKEDGSLFKGYELFAFALVVSPSNVAFRVPLLDDGINFDDKANDGLFTGYLDWNEQIVRKHYREFEGQNKKIEDLLIGFWRIYIYAQDINDASPSMKPTEAATHIGGMMVASATNVTFDSSLPCPLTADATVQVVP
jgi:hypothetical protein